MSLWGGQRRYACRICQQELKLDGVHAVTYFPPAPGEFDGYLDIDYACPNHDDGRKSIRFVYYPDALRRLFGGGMPELPWTRQPPDTRPKLTLMEKWRWHLSGVHTAHDFLLWCRGPREFAEGDRS